MTRRRPAPTTTVPSGQRVHAQIVHAATWAGHHQQPLFITAAVLVVAVWIVQWRVQRWKAYRKSLRDGISQPFATALGCPVKVKKCKVRDRRVTYMRIHWEPHGRENSPAITGLQAIIEGRMGGPVSLNWHAPSRTVTLAAKHPQKPVDDPAGIVGRAQTVARQLLGEHAQVESPTLNLDGKFKSFVIAHASIKDADQEFRKSVDNTMQSKLGQRFQSQWDQAHDRVTFRSALRLPAFAPYPTDLTVDVNSLPFGIDANNNIVAWNLDGATPHMIVGGPTGGGKSVLLRNIILGAPLRNIEVRICDPKQVSMLGLETWPGVTVLASDVDSMAAELMRVSEEVQARYTALKERKVKRQNLRRLVVVIDELWEALVQLEEAHKDAGGKSVAPAIRAFRSIARIGRECRVHLVVGLQRPDAEITKGETRANFGCRVIVGDSTVEIRRMLRLEKVTISEKVDGRGVCDTGRGEREVQVFWLDDPENYADLAPADRVIIDGLRPPAPVSTIYPDRPAGTVQPRLHSSTQNASQPAEPLEVAAARTLQLVPTELEPEPEKVPEPTATRYCRGCETAHPVTDFRDKESRCREFERRRQAAIRAAKRGVPSR